MCVCIVVYGRMWSKGLGGRGCEAWRLLHVPHVNVIRGFYEENKQKKNIQLFIRFPSCRGQRIRKRDCLMNNSEVFFVCVCVW